MPSYECIIIIPIKILHSSIVRPAARAIIGALETLAAKGRLVLPWLRNSLSYRADVFGIRADK